MTNFNDKSTPINTKIDPQATAFADKSLIIFDWDGTLIDSIGLIVESMRYAGQVHGYDATDDTVKSVIGLSVLKGMELIYPQASKEEHQAIEETYNDYYIKSSSNPNNRYAKFFDGVEPTIQQLIRQGKLLAVATGKSRAGLDRLMKVTNSASYFVSTRCADESGSKPNPKMLNDILEQTQKQVEDAVFIGDSIHDINMANAIGMMSIAVNYGAGKKEDLVVTNPTYQVDTPSQLIELLNGNYGKC